jgi:methyl-accepting chemotaxis protein
MQTYEIDQEMYRRFSDTVARFVVGYNKSVVQTQVTAHSFAIITRNIEQIKNQLSTVVTAFEEIRATSESTSKSSASIDAGMARVLEQNSKVGESISKREGEINEATANARRIGDLFKKLTEKSHSIQNASAEIHDVSDRTNVLAINASIEAARAGAVGRGFRIIANEVKKLAGQTGAFAVDIGRVTEEFAVILREIENQMQEFVELISGLGDDFQWLKNAFGETASAAQETSQSMAQITGAIKEETFAMNEGLSTLESTFQYLSDSHSVLTSIVKSHEYLDRILSKMA